MSTLEFGLSAAQIPHFSEWLGLWSMQERAFDALLAMISQTDIGAHVARQQALAAAGESRGIGYRTDRDGVALVQLRGTLQKQQASMSASTSTVMARRDIRAAVNDPGVSAIMLVIDSPGGTVAGTAELAADVREAAAVKPVHAFVEDLCCSAAYWIASQATHISANELAVVGSIGTYAIVADSSASAEREGLKVHVVKSSGAHMKGAGVPGSPISEAQLAEIQSLINSRQEFFSRDVAAGRHLPRSTVNALATGQVWSSADAKAKGLIDKVQSLDAAFSEVKAVSKKQVGKGAIAMSDNPLAKFNAAIDAEMVAQNCDRQTAAFRIRRRMPELVTAVREHANAHQAAQPQPSQSEGNPYWEKVKALQRTQGISRAAAMKAVNVKHPELREHARV